jgi:integrase
MAKKHPEDPARWKYDYRDKFFDRLCRLAGVREMGYHALRHQKASELADRGESLPYIRDFLGHKDISTTSLYLQSLGVKKKSYPKYYPINISFLKPLLLAPPARLERATHGLGIN